MPLSCPLTLRLVKGSRLTHAELDNNFLSLQNCINSISVIDSGIFLPLSGGSMTGPLSACTDGIYVSDLYSCGNGITINSDLIISGDTYNNGIIYSGGTPLTTIITNLSSASDTFITGTTFNNATYDLTLRRNDGVNFTENLAVLANDVFVLSGVYNISTGIVTFTNNTGGTFNVSGFTSGMTDSYTTSATLSGNTIQFNNNIQGNNLYSVDLSSLVFTGNTSGDCISDLYVSNIHSCSPLNINPFDEGNVYIGSTSGVTIDVFGSNLGIGVTSPSAKLHIKGDGTGTNKSLLITNSAGDESLRVLNNQDTLFGTEWAANRGHVEIYGAGNGEIRTYQSGGGGFSRMTYSRADLGGTTVLVKGSDQINYSLFVRSIQRNSTPRVVQYLKSQIPTLNDGTYADADLRFGGNMRIATTAGSANETINSSRLRLDSALRRNIFDYDPNLSNDQEHVFGIGTDGWMFHIADVGTNVDVDSSGSTVVSQYNVARIEQIGIEAVSGGTGTEVTYTDAATLKIDGPPTATLNSTLITNPYSLWVSSGNIRYQDGNEGAGKVLTSDANGVATWQTLVVTGGTSNPFTGNTSGDCITDLYVSNIHSCSPLNINPLNEGNVYFGANGDLTLIISATTASTSHLGINNIEPGYPLHVNGSAFINDGSLAVGSTSPDPAHLLRVSTDDENGPGVTGIRVDMSHVAAGSAGINTNYGIQVRSVPTKTFTGITQLWGVNSNLTSTVSTTGNHMVVAGRFRANSTNADNFGIQIEDGTEGAGKVLVCQPTSLYGQVGLAHWGQITSSGITSDTYVNNATLSGDTLVFDRNDSPNAFSVDLSSLSSVETTDYFVASTNNQTIFNGVLTTTPSDVTKTKFFINGTKQRYGNIYDYVITGGTDVVWVSADFIIDTTDELNMIYN